MFYNRKYNSFYNDLLRNWLDNKTGIKTQTKEKYEYLIELFLIPYFDNIRIKKLNINTFINFFKEKEEKLSISTRRMLLYIIKSSWEYAMIYNQCKSINFKEIKFGKYNPKITIFTKSEQHLLEQELLSKINIRKLAILLCLYTGIRIGEVCGLKWGDIDLENEILYVNRTITRIKNRNVVEEHTKTILFNSTPKSNTSIREIPIPFFIIKLLKLFKTKDEYYILSSSEKIYDPRSLEYHYKKILKKCGIRCTKFHTLRHTFATRSIESKMDVKTLSEILGHSNVKITLSFYVHSDFETKSKSINELAKFMTTI